MSRAVRKSTRRFQRGIAAVELAIILPVMLTLLTVPLYFGRVFWHYTVAQKAAHDATRYMSDLPLTEFSSTARIGFALAVAREIAKREMSDFNPDSSPVPIDFQCEYASGYATCDTSSAPISVRSVVKVSLFDPIFASPPTTLGRDKGLFLSADVRMPYVAK